ncbi:etoposide-induced protein 2.4-like [Antedon mediterranea]|uniref:etoposide-induced protein 2.4-like n=1 Tax=Antedon mediterranea TaxID=105859 RepID=UPI003AF892CF
MADGLQSILRDVVFGMKDAVLGSTIIFTVDKEIAAKQEKRRKEYEESQKNSRRPPIKMKKEEEPRILQRVLQCCALNGGVFWLSIIVFNSMLIPLLHALTHLLLGDSSSQNIVWSWMKPALSYTFSALWVIPVFLLSKIVSSFWFQDIADAAYKKSKGRPRLPSLSRLVADIMISILIQTLFLMQSLLVSLIPLSGVGQFLKLLHLCILNSLYAFEYTWFNQGWEVHKRLSFIESNWPYFVGFGLPLALITSLPSSFFVSGCLFSILFPLFIISGNEAHIPKNTCPYPVHIFSVVSTLANRIMKRSVVATSKQK